MTEISRLLESGFLGFYDQVEVTEVFACLPDKSIVNILTIVVAEDRNGVDLIQPEIISGDRIKIKSLKGWRFGIYQYTKSITQILSVFDELSNTGCWLASGKPVQRDNLEYQPARFVAPDLFEKVPLNHILKNNFFNGSYIFEWYDIDKSTLAPLIQAPALLQSLSEQIQQYCPIELASVSDRLGNVIFQLPVTVLMTQISRPGNNSDLEITVAWHPKATARNLRVNCEMAHDQILNGYGSYQITGEKTQIPIQYYRGQHKWVIWDEQNKLILAATQPGAFFDMMTSRGRVNEPEPRVFKILINGCLQTKRVAVQTLLSPNTVGDARSNTESWIQQRLYKEEKEKLAQQRKFIQYKPKHGVSKLAEHERAVDDLRALICQYGERGVWLWDPYLDANDILKTLFYCPFYGSDLRALTNLEVAPTCLPENEQPNGGQSQLNKQQQILTELESNFYGLKLEFRARAGKEGWEFHDRFLIFPDAGHGTHAWSLGTSVNSLGKKHHILQKVDDGQLIADAFLELWEQLDREKHLIWRYQ